MAWAEWLACINRSDCQTCRQTFRPTAWDNENDRMQKKNGPPCKECQPESWPVNEQALNIYQLCSSQVIMSGMGGPIAINEIAVLNRIRLEGVKRKDQRDLVNDIVFVANRVISLRNEKRQAEQENK